MTSMERLAALRAAWKSQQELYYAHTPMPDDADERTLILWDMEEQRLCSATSAARTAYDAGLREYEAELQKSAEISDREADNIANGQDEDDGHVDDGEAEF